MFISNDDGNTHVLTVEQVQAVSSPSENPEFSQESLSFQLGLINSTDRKYSALIIAPQRIYLIQKPDLKLSLITNVHIKLYFCNNLIKKGWDFL